MNFSPWWKRSWQLPAARYNSRWSPAFHIIRPTFRFRRPNNEDHSHPMFLGFSSINDFLLLRAFWPSYYMSYTMKLITSLVLAVLCEKVSVVLTMGLTAYNYGKLFVQIWPLVPVLVVFYSQRMWSYLVHYITSKGNDVCTHRSFFTYHNSHDNFGFSDHGNHCEHQIIPYILRQHIDHQTKWYWWSKGLMEFFHVVIVFIFTYSLA